MEEEWGFLPIDATNASNLLNQISMLWQVQHKWPSGARFIFNCYKHWAILIVCNGCSLQVFVIHSKEGVTQGDPLAMFCYRIGVIPLILGLLKEFPNLFQPWYADDAAAGGKFADLKKY